MIYTGNIIRGFLIGILHWSSWIVCPNTMTYFRYIWLYLNYSNDLIWVYVSVLLIFCHTITSWSGICFRICDWSFFCEIGYRFFYQNRCDMVKSSFEYLDWCLTVNFINNSIFFYPRVVYDIVNICDLIRYVWCYNKKFLFLYCKFPIEYMTSPCKYFNS